MTTVPTCECGGREAHYYEHPAATQPTTRTLLMAGALATVLALTACSQSNSGTPTPAQGATETTTTSTTTSSTASASPITDIDPCTLLSSTERAQLGNLGEGERNDLGGGIGCGWAASGSHRATVVLNDKLSLDDFAKPGDQVIDFTVNGRQAKKIPGNEKAATDNMCEIGLEIGPHARAHIVVNMADGTAEEACQLAEQVAQAVEPKLPRS